MSFWAETAEQKAGEIALLFKAEKSGMELSYFTSAFISGSFSIFSVLPGYFFLRTSGLEAFISSYDDRILFACSPFLLYSARTEQQRTYTGTDSLAVFSVLPVAYISENEYRYPVPAALEETAIVLNLFFHYTEITSLFCAQRRGSPTENTLKSETIIMKKKEPITNGLDRTSQ